jgi:hypothetical protein
MRQVDDPVIAALPPIAPVRRGETDVGGRLLVAAAIREMAGRVI